MGCMGLPVVLVFPAAFIILQIREEIFGVGIRVELPSFLSKIK